MATQNPIESEGTYPLPEAQVDRFMLKILIGYPAHDEELTIVQRQLDSPPELRETLTLDELRAAPAAVLRRSTSTRRSISYAVTLADATREPGRARARRARRLHLLRREPARPDQPRPGARARSRSSAAATTSLAEDVQRARDGRAPPPARALVPGARGGGEPRTGSSTRVLAAVPVPAARPRADERGVSALQLSARGSTPARPGPGPLPAALLRALDVDDRPADARACSPATTARRCSATAPSSRRSGRTSPGDDVRRIDWNVTARTGEPHVRVQLAERVLVTWLVLDTSPSMRFGTADRRKADVAEGVAIAVGHVATRRGNRLGVRHLRRRGPADAPAAPGPRRPASGCSRRSATSRRPSRGRSARPRSARRSRRAGVARPPALARRRRLRLPRPARLAQAAARARRPPRRRRRRDPRPARAGAAERRRALARRSRDRPAAPRRHAQREAPRPLRGRRRRGAARTRAGRSRRSASATSSSPRPATGCARSPPSCGGRAGELLVARCAARCSLIVPLLVVALRPPRAAARPLRGALREPRAAAEPRRPRGPGRRRHLPVAILLRRARRADRRRRAAARDRRASRARRRPSCSRSTPPARWARRTSRRRGSRPRRNAADRVRRHRAEEVPDRRRLVLEPRAPRARRRPTDRDARPRRRSARCTRRGHRDRRRRRALRAARAARSARPTGRSRRRRCS